MRENGLSYLAGRKHIPLLEELDEVLLVTGYYKYCTPNGAKKRLRELIIERAIKMVNHR